MSPLLAWAVPRLAELLPLDDDSLKQLINYSEGLSKDESADHLKNLLGDSPAALEFISSFNARRTNTSSSPGTKNIKPKEYTMQSSRAAGSGSLISNFLPNVKSKSAKQHPPRYQATASPSTTTVTTNNIADLTSAIAALEMTTNPTLRRERRKCNCYASIHPLFEPAPNCLNCGKIICALEGFQPCSFCGTPLISNDEVHSMIKELRAERGQEKMRAHNESSHHGGPSRSEDDDKLDMAKAHRDRLLSFQAQNARRTRVVDEAADFETPNLGSTQWMSPAQRALALKKQQRIQREMDEKARPEWEKKKKTFMSLDIKGGKVRRVYHLAEDDDTEKEKEKQKEAEEEQEQDQEIMASELASNKQSNGNAFSRNPLLASGGLLRPIWRAPEDKQSQTMGKEKKQTWRRVQDDRDDNEQWILDGGLHGYDDVN